LNFFLKLFYELPRHLVMHAAGRLVERQLEPKTAKHDPSVPAGEFHATDSSSRLRVLEGEPVRIPCCLCGREVVVLAEEASGAHYCAPCRARPAG